MCFEILKRSLERGRSSFYAFHLDGPNASKIRMTQVWSNQAWRIRQSLNDNTVPECIGSLSQVVTHSICWEVSQHSASLPPCRGNRTRCTSTGLRRVFLGLGYMTAEWRCARKGQARVLLSVDDAPRGTRCSLHEIGAASWSPSPLAALIILTSHEVEYEGLCSWYSQCCSYFSAPWSWRTLACRGELHEVERWDVKWKNLTLTSQSKKRKARVYFWRCRLPNLPSLSVSNIKLRVQMSSWLFEVSTMRARVFINRHATTS